MAEAESEEAVSLAVKRHREKTSEMLKSLSSIVLPASTVQKSSSILTKSLAEMMNDDPIRLQNQSCVIREEIVEIGEREQLVYSSLARLPTFSIGLSSTKGEDSSRAQLRESIVDPKDKSPHRYFQMPDLGARVFVGDRAGLDTIACQIFDDEFNDSHFASVKTLYDNDRPGGLSGWLQTRPKMHWGTEEVILSGTELFSGHTYHGNQTCHGKAMVGNLGGKSSRVSGSSSDYKDCTVDETTTQPSDIVELPGDPHCYNNFRGYWITVERPYLYRPPEGSYLKKPKLMELDDLHPSYDLLRSVIHLTRFDDFVILGNEHFNYFSFNDKLTIDIVRENASETADVIAAQLVKSFMKEIWTIIRCPITVIVIFLDHKEILLREQKKETMAPKDKAIISGLLEPKAISQSIVLKDDKVIAKSKEEKKITTLKEEEKVFALEIKDKRGIMMEGDHNVKIVVDEPLPNIPQVSFVSLEENELGMKPTTMSSNLTSVEVQDDFGAPSSVVFIEDDDCKSEGFMVSCYITKWIIYGDLLERTLLCFFNIEEMQYEFYFEDHESMATIIGVGVPHSKVILECGSPHVTVVEIPEEDWVVVWAHSNDIPCSIPQGNVMKQDLFPDILHRIANNINIDNIVSKSNDGGVGGDNGKGKGWGNVNDSKGKGKAHGHGNDRSTSHPNGGSNGGLDDNDKKERKEKDGNNDKKEGHNGDDEKTSNDGKEVQVVVHLRLLPGGILKEKKKDDKIYEEVVEEQQMKGKSSRGIGMKNKNKNRQLWHPRKRCANGNVVGNQQKGITTEVVENDDVDENLQKQLENQIHVQMVFTFKIKYEAGGPFTTIQATMDAITFQLPSNNKKNYLRSRRFGWFHRKLHVAFGVVDIQAADLDAKSWKVLDCSEVKEVNLQGNSEGNARTSTNAIKGEIGIRHGVIASAGIGRTGGSGAHTTKAVQDTWETNKPLTRGGFSILNCSDQNSKQLKYSYFPLFPFNEKEFEAKDEVERLKMYENSICQLQQVSCEGTWQPLDSGNLEAYKLEASRKVGMTRIYNVDLETREETKQKGVWKVGKHLPLYFIQTLDKVVYLNHAMSHLISSTGGVYRLKEKQGLIDPSTTFVTQAQNRKEPNWHGNDRLVDVKQLKETFEFS